MGCATASSKPTMLNDMKNNKYQYTAFSNSATIAGFDILEL